MQNGDQKRIELIEPSGRLVSDVFLRIIDERQTPRIRAQFVVFCSLFLSSALGLVQATIAFTHAAAHSGLPHILSLVFTDGGAVLESWEDFGYSILESIPASSLIIILSLSLLFLISLNYILREFKRVMGLRLLTHS